MRGPFVPAAVLIAACLPNLVLAEERPFVEPPREAVEARQRNELMSKEIQIRGRQQRAGGDAAAMRQLRESYRAAEQAQERMRSAPPENYPFARERSDERLLELDRTIGR